ncbi:MAG: glutamine--tRNA ligase/YqeY domain fusion protein [Gemmatimonadales bacterium]
MSDKAKSIEPTDFIRAKVAADVASDRFGRPITTRFPPEPNGYLHIGHAKAICLSYGIAEEAGGLYNLRFDDTNPETEDMEFVDAIQHDIRWLGYDWEDRLYFASDYFEQLYEFAVRLIEKGKAYVDDSTEQEIRDRRGTVTTPGTPSPYRDRSVAENLDLFERMKNGEFEDGSRVLRAKIDMTAANMLMRDPILYRIRRAHHYRRGDDWCIYPMYDFAHCLSDAIEGITHSLCSLEFTENRAPYEWLVREVGFDRPPEQTEFARLNLDYTVMSKRKLIRLVEDGYVGGWDDPRLPTLAGLRRRGVPPESIRAFCDLVGVARVNSRVDMGKLEFTIRDYLNSTAPRVMCVLRPLKVVIRNYPDDDEELLDAQYYPHDVPLEGTRPVPFGREIFIEAEDFSEDPPKGFHRLAPGREVRLRYAYFIRCVDVVKDDDGKVAEVICEYDPATRGGDSPDGRKVKGTLHWVSAKSSVPCEVRLYDRLFTVPNPEDIEEGEDFTSNLNPDSFVVLSGSRIEPSVRSDPIGLRYQFERQGYFVGDAVDSSEDSLVYNRIVGLRDTWAKISAKREGTRVEDPARVVREKAGKGKGRAATTAQQDEAPAAGADITALVERGIHEDEAAVIAANALLKRLFDDAAPSVDDPRLLAHWIVNDVQRAIGESNDEPRLAGEQLARLIGLVTDGAISRAAARDVLAEVVTSGGDPAAIVERRGLGIIADGGELDRLVRDVVARFPDKVSQYRSGKEGLLGFFMGRLMKDSGGRASPEVAKRKLEELLRS